MRYNIDVVFLDKQMRIVRIIRNIKPWRMTWIYFKSHQVIEMADKGDIEKSILLLQKCLEELDSFDWAHR